ncbi:MAG: hypothetical protein J6A59_18490 [Lachnospiraceae bacterium]|nr:hypothetical protein [Lachnospiraceae bacterium]
MVLDNKKEQIRVLISNIYDLQKMRISVGNRLVQSIYLQMGVLPGMSPEAVKAALVKFYEDGRDTTILERAIKGETERIVDEETGKSKTVKPPSVLDLLLKDYKRVTDMISEPDSNVKTVKKAISTIAKSGDASGLNIIRDENDIKLIESYTLLLKSEEESVKVLEKYVQEHPMWDAFFKDIKGCGPLMSGICLAYLDPWKAPHVSCFFRYAGVDVVQDMDKEGNKIFVTLDGNKRKVKQVFDDNGDYKYIDCETEEEYEGEVMASCHGRRKGDTEMQTYYIINDDGDKVLAVDKDGKPLLKNGITYNPKLKTKLMGVLTGCLLKAKDPTYSKIYYDLRMRYDNSPYYKDTSDAHKNMMAQRYMVKEFLRAMWITWRRLEGLEVDEPYEVAKLGNRPHKYNEYQCKVAEETKNSKAV